MTTRELFLNTFESIDFEKITEHPNILIAANFWEAERYQAARTCYKFMRMIDDLIDNHKADNKMIAEHEKQKFSDNVEKWLIMLLGKSDNTPFREELQKTMERFRIPRWPLEAFAKSMLYDIHHDGFESIAAFIEYSQGASVAPASIFVHLAGLQENKGVFSDPPFDVRKTATPCAIFSYMVHIIRDFRKDQLHNLNYFADDVIAKNNLSRKTLRRIAEGESIPAGFRKMMDEYYHIADEYRIETIQAMSEIFPKLSPQYRLSFEIIFELYLMVFERIDIKNGTFSTEELNPSPFEVKERVKKVIMRQKE